MQKVRLDGVVAGFARVNGFGLFICLFNGACGEDWFVI